MAKTLEDVVLDDTRQERDRLKSQLTEEKRLRGQAILHLAERDTQLAEANRQLDLYKHRLAVAAGRLDWFLENQRK